MKIDLRDKKALVCGASSGIGKAIAALFVEAGCSLILVGRNKSKLGKIFKEQKKTKKQFIHIFELDLMKTSEVIKFSNSYLKKNSIDILVNNSGGPLPRDILKCTISDYQNVFNQHFLAVNILTLEAVKNMMKNRYGRIINILGTSIIEPIPNLSLSCIKSTTANWSKSLSKKIARYNVTINNILPGPTNTPELKEISNILSKAEGINQKQYYKNLINSIDVKRVADPKEIAYLTLFLASEYSSYITGSSLVIDGGYSKSI